MAIVNINNGQGHKFSNSIIRDDDDSYSVDVAGSMRAKEVVVPINDRDEPLGAVLTVLINTLIANGIMSKEEFEDQMNAVKIANILAGK